MARFVSEDPIGLSAGINEYAFAGNNPISHRDQSGLEPEIICEIEATNWLCAYWSDSYHGRTVGSGELEWPSGQNPNPSDRGMNSGTSTGEDYGTDQAKVLGGIRYAGRLLTPWQPILENATTAELLLVSSMSWGMRSTTTVIGNYSTYLHVSGALGAHAFNLGEFGNAFPKISSMANRGYISGRILLGEDFRLALRNPFVGEIGEGTLIEEKMLQSAGYIQKGLWWVRP